MIRRILSALFEAPPSVDTQIAQAMAEAQHNRDRIKAECDRAAFDNNATDNLPDRFRRVDGQ